MPFRKIRRGTPKRCLEPNGRCGEKGQESLEVLTLRNFLQTVGIAGGRGRSVEGSVNVPVARGPSGLRPPNEGGPQHRRCSTTRVPLMVRPGSGLKHNDRCGI